MPNGRAYSICPCGQTDWLSHAPTAPTNVSKGVITYGSGVSIPPFCHPHPPTRVHASFVRDEDYFPNLVWLLLTMYRIPADDPVAVEIGKAVAVGALEPYSHAKDAGVRLGLY